MKAISQEIQNQSIKSLESTCNKLATAYQRMTEKGVNTTLVKKRLNAVKMGLESLKNIWNGENFSSDEETILISKKILEDIMPSIEKQIAKAKEGSSQKTLNDRRLTALKLAIESLEKRLSTSLSD